MGRPAKVKSTEVIPLLVKNMDIFKTNDFPSTTDKIWTNLSEALGKRWLPHSWYTHVTEDKKGDLTAARQQYGISTPSPRTVEKTVEKKDVSASELFSDDSKVQNLESSFKDEEMDPNLEEFHVFLASAAWDKMKPDNTSESTTRRLKAGMWVNPIANAFYLRYNMPCALIGEWSQVKTDEDGSVHLKFQPKCKSKKCSNVFFGTAKHSGTGGLNLDIRARDTRHESHEDVKRPLNGLERVQVGDNLVKQQPENYRKELLRDNMHFGESVPPTVRRGYIYRQAKAEAVKRAYCYIVTRSNLRAR
ncbi:uncharacterized protein LOC107046162 [Diachasma alloeum]|uniref:uncharacterized protein LOC107046162 n=1 Tax=Diachasma alloeum TaxID=454923 RepID=UPI000738141C|nr:uncharacterized protein LOC107046162 [Diachasma alloeum]